MAFHGLCSPCHSLLGGDIVVIYQHTVAVSAHANRGFRVALCFRGDRSLIELLACGRGLRLFLKVIGKFDGIALAVEKSLW